MRDIQWHNWSNIYAWHLRGAWADVVDENEINCMAVNNEENLMVVGDSQGNVSFNFLGKVV